MKRTPKVLLAMVGASALGFAPALPSSAGSGVTLPKTYASGLTAAQVTALAKNPTQHVIVVFRDQHGEAPAVRGRASVRAAKLAHDQSPVISELHLLRAPAVRPFRLLNAVSATMSAAEAARLATNPAVQAVLPDRLVAVSKQIPTTTAAGGTAGPSSSSGTPDPGTSAGGRCPQSPSTPLLEPEALQLMNVENQAGITKPAAHDIVDGTGVKVGFVADGVDITNPDFQRNGHSVFYAYRDFSGDGVNAPSSGAEAFGDASAIAAQGTQSYDLSTYVSPLHPIPAGCNIRVKGVAPGASLAAEKAFGNANFAANSIILQAMEAAVLDDHVDVLNESFGGNPTPDNNATDLTSLFDEQAVAAGVTVVASTGDAGITNTLGSPGTDPGVIAAGATTQLRGYAQTTSYGYQTSRDGWVSNQISSLSSGGIGQLTPRTLDIVAPGDLGWALCTPTATYTGCANPYGGSALGIQLFGGTSQSSPLTAGTAALVIQAYRQTHKGASPSPALVKRIITSSATDLGARAQEQGSGLVNALAAVRLAQSVSDAAAAPAAQGDTLLISPNVISLTGSPGSSHTVPVTVTNTGARSQDVGAKLRSLTDPMTIADGVVQLRTSDEEFVDSFNRPSRFVKVPFTVPQGVDRLDATISYNGNSNGGSGRARMTLFDPQGRDTVYTLNQGPGGFGQVDVHQPESGTWTALIWMIDLNPLAYVGPVHFTMTAQHFESGGSVSPAMTMLQPGESRTFQVTVHTPPAPGDDSSSLVFSSDRTDMTNSVPVIKRSLIPLSETGGRFSGLLSGGNGRMSFGAQMFTYQFDVPAGTPDISISLVTGNVGYIVDGVLIGPDGMAVDYATSTITDLSVNPPVTVNTPATQLFRRAPAAGRWTFDVLLNLPITSLQTSRPFHANIALDAIEVRTKGVPNGATLAAGTPVTAKVTVHNTGVEPELFFVDPRLNRMDTLALQSLFPTAFTIPLTGTEVPAQFLVPTNTDQLNVAVQGSVPVATDTSPAIGDPDVISHTTATGAVATVSAAELTATVWSCLPVEIGPFPASGQPAATASCGATAHTAGFDAAATSSTGDFWLQSVQATPPPFSPLLLNPNQSGTIAVTFTPTGAPGTKVSGFLGVDTFDPAFPTSSQLANVPYSYTVG